MKFSLKIPQESQSKFYKLYNILIGVTIAASILALIGFILTLCIRSYSVRNVDIDLTVLKSFSFEDPSNIDISNSEPSLGKLGDDTFNCYVGIRNYYKKKLSYNCDGFGKCIDDSYRVSDGSSKIELERNYTLYEYAVNFIYEKDDKYSLSTPFKQRIINTVSIKVAQKYKNFMFIGSALFSEKKVEEVIQIPTEYHSWNYITDIQPTSKTIDMSKDSKAMMDQYNAGKNETKSIFEIIIEEISTIGQAIGNGKENMSKYIALTHFSPRYIKTYPFKEEFEQKKILLANGYLTLNLNELSLAYKYLKPFDEIINSIEQNKKKKNIL